MFVVSRAYVYAIAWAALRFGPKSEGYLPPRTVADWFLRWDALWYFDVAEHGYHFTRAGDQTNVVFFPLYPWLLRTVSLNGWIDYRLAGYAVSLTGLWLACVLLWKLVARELRDPTAASLSVAFLLFAPVSFFFSTLYSESWFLPLTIGSIAAARQRQWWLAGALGALAGLTRFVGIALVAPLAWEWLQTAWRERGSGHRPRAWSMFACALPIAGFATYCLVMWVEFGDPLLYFHAEKLWNRRFAWFWDLFARQSYAGLPLFYKVWFAGAVVAGFGLLLAAALQRQATVFVVHGLVLSFIYISANGVEALPRYFSVVFPLYIAAALLVRGNHVLRWSFLACSLGLAALSVTLFVNGYWFT